MGFGDKAKPTAEEEIRRIWDIFFPMQGLTAFSSASLPNPSILSHLGKPVHETPMERRVFLTFGSHLLHTYLLPHAGIITFIPNTSFESSVHGFRPSFTFVGDLKTVNDALDGMGDRINLKSGFDLEARFFETKNLRISVVSQALVHTIHNETLFADPDNIVEALGMIDSTTSLLAASKSKSQRSAVNDFRSLGINGLRINFSEAPIKYEIQDLRDPQAFAQLMSFANTLKGNI